MQSEPAPCFKSGDKVRLKAAASKKGMIDGDPAPNGDSYLYLVYFSADEIVYHPEDHLELVPKLNGIQLLPHKSFLKDLLLLKLQMPYSDNLYSYGASRTKYRVYQFKPALKFLSLPDQRILIADEVGLGKTIEAGIIYLELKARLDLARVLVICPSGLRDKWQSEMRSRFDEPFDILDAPALRRFVDDYAEHGGATRLRGITSLELLRRQEFAEAFAELHVRFDLAIIDEAHHLRNTATMAHAIGEIVAAQSDALLLLTATPLQTGNRDLFHLMQLIDPAGFTNFDQFARQIAPNQFINEASRLIDDGRFADALERFRLVETTDMAASYRANPYYIESLDLLSRSTPPNRAEVVGLQRRMVELNPLSRIFNRTRKRDVTEDAAQRAAYTVNVPFSPAERAFYDAVIDLVRWQLHTNDPDDRAPMFTVITRERQAASCIQALRETFVHDLEASLRHLDQEESSPELLENGNHEETVGQAESRRIQELLAICTAIGDTDTKFDYFLESLDKALAEEPEGKILVFSFFRGTLSYLHRRLTQLGYQVSLLHGGVLMNERTGIIDEFRKDSDLHIMLSSEVGSEGLDFQFCGTMFNYDLPWNPMRVEQRIGRLDRFGQEHEKIHIYNLVIDDTVETRIFLRLYDRIRIFESSIGDLEAILGEQVKKLSADIFMQRLTPEEEEKRADQAIQRIELLRQLQEEFEEQRGLFAGQDGIFNQEMSSIIESGRYVAPDEVRSLVECYLAEACPRSTLQPNDGDPTYTLQPSDDLSHALATYAASATKNVPGLYPFLQRLQSARTIPLTFDADTAQQRRLLEFITVYHPLTRLAVNHLVSRGAPPPPKTSLLATSPSGLTGDYAFFLYRLDVTCLTPQTSLLPVLAKLDTGQVDPDASAGFLAALQRRYDGPIPDIACDAQRFATLERQARAQIALTAAEKEKETLQRNEALVEARLAAVEMSHRFKIDIATHQLETTTQERIQRMRRSQIANLEASLQAKRAEIKSRRAVSVGFSPVASGFVRLENPE